MRKNRRNARRTGVILMVVLGLLTLFSILGLSFAVYADNQAQASDLLRTARAAAPVIQRDLLESLAGDRDFSASHEAIDALTRSAESLQDVICQACDDEPDPRERLRCKRTCATLQKLTESIKLLDLLIRQIEIAPLPVAA